MGLSPPNQQQWLLGATLDLIIMKCGDAGLSEKMRQDRRVMTDLSRHICVEPNTRVRRLIDLREQIQQ